MITIALQEELEEALVRATGGAISTRICGTLHCPSKSPACAARLQALAREEKRKTMKFFVSLPAPPVAERPRSGQKSLRSDDGEVKTGER